VFSQRLFSAGIAVVMAVFAFPGVALAARYASPGASALASCTSGDPCSLATAVNSAGTGDEIIVASGDYNLGSGGLVVPAGANVHGVDGAPRPLIFSATDFVAGNVVKLPLGGSLRHLAIRQDGVGGAAVDATAATLGDLAVENTYTNPEGSTAARLGGGTIMSGSTALDDTQDGVAIAGGLGTATLHNVTAWGGSSGMGIFADVGTSVTGTNVIARAPGGSDISGTVALAASNYDGAPFPLLANPAGNDFHQLPGSPTIDAGVPDPAAGLTDMDGDARILGANQDIGADEYVSHRAAASTGAANGTTVTGTVMPNGLPTTYRFDFGVTPLYGSSTPAGDAGAGTSQVPVSAQLPALPAGSIVHYRVVATNTDGETPGLDRILVVPGTLTGTQLNAPHFTTLSSPLTTTVGQPITITASGSDRNDPVNSIAIDFDDGPGYFAESACRLRPKSRAFRDGRLSTFSVPYTFSTPGVHTIEVTLGSGSCGKTRQASTQTTQITVLPPGKRLARTRASAVTVAADCPNADLLPAPGNTGKIENATFCLLNQMRVQNGLKPFRRNKKLRRAAALHNGYMLREHFMAHQGPGEPPLGARFHKVKYPGGGGENIGVGAGMPYATPRSMVIAWMNSPVHRANILERAFRTIGINVAAQKPIPPPPVPGASYVTEFGTTKR
jgi:uncharacterized protein YkwD